MLVGVLPQGPTGVELSSTFKHREGSEYKLELGRALANFAKLVPQGMLVFFPSYSAMNSAVSAWREKQADGLPGPLDRIGKIKHVFIEPKDPERGAPPAAKATPAFEEDPQGALVALLGRHDNLIEKNEAMMARCDQLGDQLAAMKQALDLYSQSRR